MVPLVGAPPPWSHMVLKIYSFSSTCIQAHSFRPVLFCQHLISITCVYYISPWVCSHHCLLVSNAILRQYHALLYHVFHFIQVTMKVCEPFVTLCSLMELLC